MEKRSIVKPIHIALGVGAIIVAMVVLPIASSIWNRAYFACTGLFWSRHLV